MCGHYSWAYLHYVLRLHAFYFGQSNWKHPNAQFTTIDPSVSPASKQLLTSHTVATVTRQAYLGKRALTVNVPKWCCIFFSISKAQNARGEMSDLV